MWNLALIDIRSGKPPVRQDHIRGARREEESGVWRDWPRPPRMTTEDETGQTRLPGQDRAVWVGKALGAQKLLWYGCYCTSLSKLTAIRKGKGCEQ